MRIFLGVLLILILSACKERGSIQPPKMGKKISNSISHTSYKPEFTKRSEKKDLSPRIKVFGFSLDTPVSSLEDKNDTFEDNSSNEGNESNIIQTDVNEQIKQENTQKQIGKSLSTDENINSVHKESISSPVKVSKKFKKIQKNNHKKNSKSFKIPHIPFFNMKKMPPLTVPNIINSLTKDSSPSVIKTKKLKQKFKLNSGYIDTFTGGTVVKDIDMGRILVGENNKYTRLIFMSYKWKMNELPTEETYYSGVYIFSNHLKEQRIKVILYGYKGFSALAEEQKGLYEDNSMIKNIHLDEQLDNGILKFTIELKRNVKINVFELQNPARIFVDMIPNDEAI